MTAKTPRGKVLEAQYDKGWLADRVGQLEGIERELRGRVLHADSFDSTAPYQEDEHGESLSWYALTPEQQEHWERKQKE